MKQTLRVAHVHTFVTALMFIAATAISMNAEAARANGLPEKLPEKLPVKRAAKAERSIQVKRTRVDFSEEPSVISVKSAPKLTKENVVVVKSRAVLPAPNGDASELMSALRETKVTAEKPATPNPLKSEPVVAAKAPVVPDVAAFDVAPAAPTPAPTIMTFPEPSIVPIEEFHRSEKIAGPDLRRSFDANETPRENLSTTSNEEEPRATPTTSTNKVDTKTGFIQAIAPETISFVRAGYLNANYKKFDDRMNNSATSIGLGVARGFETTWGSFEARAAFDAYHAMDQSVTVDNVRMLSIRTEVAYWFSHSRVKPGVSLGLGWADYSIRSYRSVSGPNEQNVTLRTHAKARAFTIIPASSLRIELGHGLMIDTQTEFLALLGGDSADAAQGLAMTISLGWLF